MLTRLSIRNVVLIDALDIDFAPGLCVLTGETGAGKSILLDALGLALGGRSDVSLLRSGADQASVTAEFQPPADHPVRGDIAEQGLEALDPGEPVILRRTLGADGRTRAFINDQAASVGLLRRLGDALIEVQGQFDQRGLLDPATHLGLLDAYAGLAKDAAEVAGAHGAWRTAEEARQGLEAELAEARADEDFLRHATTELAELAPEIGEEDSLQAERSLLMNRERLVDALNAALGEVAGPHPAEDALRQAARHLERVADKAGGAFDPVVAAFDRAIAETAEAVAALEAAGSALDGDTGRLAVVDERLFALRDVARKHRVGIDDRPALRESFADRLATLDTQGDDLVRASAEAESARRAFEAAARALSKKRYKAARMLDQAVAAELPPLKLDRAHFQTRLTDLAEDQWGAEGLDKCRFEVSTNPGAEPGPLGKIASGGELSRFMLALKVVLSRGSTAPTLVFDEVDSGIGGATAAAAGDRLARLAEALQILVVTHSPQVAARGGTHWRVSKASGGNGKASAVLTRVDQLGADDRREEIARMLAGRQITDEARAAADALMAGASV